MACPHDNRPCRFPRCARCIKPLSALDDARHALWRATDCGSSILRMDYLYRARDALNAAGFPRWADLAEAAAGRIGGGADTERLRFDVDVEISRHGR